MNLTERQKNCVTYRNRTLLVSAGAGSGKTSTLSKRIIARLSDPNDEAEIDRFLIVTFTNASAKDLSEKIESALTESFGKTPSDKKTLRQLLRMKYANISTISSFCLGAVKSHFEQLSLPANLRVCDPTESERLLAQVIVDLTEEKYAEGTARFLRTAELFSGTKNDEGFLAWLAKLYRKVYSFPSPDAYMDKALSYYREAAENEEFFDTYYGKKIREDMLASARTTADELYAVGKEYSVYEELSKYTDGCFAEAEEIAAFAETLEKGSYADCLARAPLTDRKRLSAKVPEELRSVRDGLTARRKEAHDRFVRLRNVYFTASPEKLRCAASDCADVTEELFSLVREIEKRFSEEKNARGRIDFADAERLAYRLLVERYDAENDRVYPTAIAEKYREKFLEIYIDEYQDINRIQDLIFRAICRYDENGHECNRFMVGDVKQSIYRFRSARPELFSGYLNRFTALSDDTAGIDEHKEYLPENFRCAENVVRFTNRVFSAIMENAYLSEDNLIYARTESHKVSFPCELLLCDSEENDEYAGEFDMAESDAENETEEEDGANAYSDEIKVVAEKILSVVNNPNYVDSNGKRFSFGDVAVLLRSPKKSAERYAKYFEECGIPVVSEITEDFFANNEIKLCLCLLHSIDNPLRDIYLVGAMRSEIFRFTDDDLTVLRRLTERGSDTERHMWYTVVDAAENENGNFDTSGQNGESECFAALSEKCRRFCDCLRDLKKRSVGLSSDRFLLHLYRELKLYTVVSERSFNRFTENAALRRANLDLLYHIAHGFEKGGFRGLSAFLDFLNDRAAEKGSLKTATLADGANAVRIMSIHHSKGLEFPVCIVSDLSHGFNRTDERAKMILSDNDGIAFKLRDIDGISSADSNSGLVSYTTPFRTVIAAEEGRAMLEEEKRVLYVAMTRAKEYLILVGKKPKKNVAEKIAADRFSPNNATCFLQWILYALRFAPEATELFSNFDGWDESKKNETDPSIRLSIVTPQDIREQDRFARTEPLSVDSFKNFAEYKEKLQKKLAQTYPHALRMNTLSKISVSELSDGKLSICETESGRPTEKAFSEPCFLQAQNEPTASERGTALHAFMQYASFSACECSVEKEAKRLLSEEYMSGEQFALLDYPLLTAFFESQLYRQMKNAKILRREVPFTLSVPFSEVYETEDGEKADDGETVLVQGRIDCFFGNDVDGYTLVDFKSDRTRTVSELCDKYKNQLKYYRRALQEMTDCDTIRVCIYSFAHKTAVELADFPC